MNKGPMTRTELILIVGALIGATFLVSYWKLNLSPGAQYRQKLRENYETKRALESNDPPKYLPDPR